MILGPEKMWEIFLYWGNDFWETPDFYIYVTINCNFMIFLYFYSFRYFFLLEVTTFGRPQIFEFMLQLNCNFMVFLDFVILWVFLLEVTTFGKPQIFTFLWVKPIFLYSIIHYRERENWGNLGEKVQRMQWGKADVGIRSQITRRAWHGFPQKQPDYSRWSASNLA